MTASEQLTSESAAAEPGNGSAIPLALAIIFWLLASLFSKWAYQPPEPRNNSSPKDVFSAERAEKYLQELVSDGIPHPAGSDQNKIVGDRIKSVLKKSFGYTVQEQFSYQPIRFSREEGEPDKVRIRNLVAIKKGSNDLGAVMLACHYDSVPSGPGASDDGVAVAAVLEMARMAQEFVESGRDIVFLFTDGEEYGLLGAKAFVEENRLAQKIEFAVNLEARGTTGPSIMFQTSSDSAQMISIFAKSIERPVASSIFEEIYKRLPNDTDFTIFRDQADMRGFNFAYIGDARNYHTPNDNVENADRGSLQHHGQNAWALLLELNQLPDLPRESRQFVYFDFFARTLFYWDANWTTAVCVVVLVMFVAWLVIQNLGVNDSGIRGILNAVVCIFGLVFFVCLACALLSYSFNLQERFSPPWVDYPDVVSLAFWSFGLTVAIWFSSWFDAEEEVCWFVTWLGWTTAAILVSNSVIGASYLFLIPPLAAWMLRLLFIRWSTASSNVLSSLVAALLWMPIGVLFYDAIGFSLNAVTMFRMAFMVSTLSPLVASTSKENLGRLAIVGAAISISSTCLALWLNPAQ